MIPSGAASAGGAASRLCIALDFPSRHEVLAAAGLCAGRVGWLKVGLEAFVSEGPALVADVAATGARVFLDLKLHDIPNTVGRAVSAAARTGASMVNVHASGGRDMLVAARQALGDEPGRPLLIAVTLLTSLDSRALADLPVAGTPEGIARRLAVLARDCGLDGVVCSPGDLSGIRAACGPSFLTVVPGIRPEGAPSGDQKRTGTPRAAIAAGADILVVGRSVLAADHPDAALDLLLAEIESARMTSR
ncbi:MAG: orotidine-5'-phosphate decarboxylase [Acidobacteriota bacterium]